jgi:hypothetical protein
VGARVPQERTGFSEFPMASRLALGVIANQAVPTNSKMSRSPLISSGNTSPSGTAGDCCGAELIEPNSARKRRVPSKANARRWSHPRLAVCCQPRERTQEGGQNR